MIKDLNPAENAGHIDFQEYSNIIRTQLKEYSLATFERAFNDSRDGLRPVSRRTLYTMYQDNLTNMFKKVQYVSGIVMKYHPYNSDTIADAITQLGQWFVKSYQFLDTQGNFGSLKNIKGYAASRYIECKLNKFIQDCITNDIDKHCITYVDNYDHTFLEPEYLPTKLPLTLIEGGSGLGEAFVNNVPPYNLGDVVDCCVKVIKNKKISLNELMNGIYPDFPTGGEIINKSEVDEFHALDAVTLEKMSREGKNYNLKYRAKINIDRENNVIEILELPFKIDFDNIWEKILNEVNVKNNVILSGIINKSDRLDPKRPENIIFELICKKDANMLEIVDQLYAKTPLSTSSSLIYILFCGKYLQRMSFKDIILSWYETQEAIIRRKINFQLTDTQNRIHILEGLVLVYDQMDDVIKVIKMSQDKESCIKALVDKFVLTLVQARGISEMQLYSLTRASKPTLLNNIKQLRDKITDLENKIENIDAIIIENLIYMKDKYNRPRRTTVIDLSNEKTMKTSINISNGSILYSRDSVGIFDATSLLNGKSLTNSLKPFRLDGRNVREIIGAHNVSKNVSGVIVFSADGTARRTRMSEIPITNNWVITNDQSIPIRCVTPVYEETEDSDCIVTISSDYKVKLFKVSEINTKKVQTGVIIAAQLINQTKVENFLIYNEFGEYAYIDKDEVPLLSRTSLGNMTSFTRGKNFNITPIYDTEASLFVTFVENEDGTVAFTAIDEIKLTLAKRTNKVKEFFKLRNSKFVGLGLVNSKTKNSSSLILIGPYGAHTIKGKLVKDGMDNKKITTRAFNIVQIPEVD
ncbi:MAG: DNA gyrase subunit A [Anaeroplasmataceae bacterium]